jgi:plasmid maintenance system antidote protein VapI
MSASAEILNEAFLKPLGLSAKALAKAIGVEMAKVHFAGWMAVRAKG